MARPRRPEDWDRDLAGARAVEQRVGASLAADARVGDLEDHTAAFDRLDFSFSCCGMRVWLDVKEKLQRYSAGVQQLWPGVGERDLFIVDETVYRRIVWQGGGGYLAIHDSVGVRWVVFGPWELTIGPRLRYGRWGRRHDARFLKGKLLLDLSAAPHQSPDFSVDLVVKSINESRRWRDRVEPYPIDAIRLPELG
ncbi:MAG: hypothetical protein M3N98_07885 [Actinomycetota bacterium]|nr:hypothetical protein [Actinomycetota bacterium]